MEIKIEEGVIDQALLEKIADGKYEDSEVLKMLEIHVKKAVKEAFKKNGSIRLSVRVKTFDKGAFSSISISSDGWKSKMSDIRKVRRGYRGYNI